MVWLLPLAVFGFTRLFGLNSLPIFADEAIYIRWAQLISQDWHKLFIPLSDGKTPLYMWLLAPLLRLNFDPLIIGRILSVMAGLASVAGVYFLAKKIFETKTARLSLWLAIFCPFLLFYDRMSLTDSLLTALIVWAAYFSGSVYLGIFAAGALLVKPSALAYLLLVPLLNLMRWRQSLLGLLIAGGIYNLLRFSDQFYMIKQRSLDYLQGPTLQHWGNTVGVFNGWLLSYLGWPLIFILALSLIIAVKFKETKIGILSLLILAPFLFQAAVGKVLYPRYLLPLVPFILMIAAWGLERLPYRLKAFLVGAVLAVWLPFDYYLLTDPVKAPLHQAEKEQYFYSWASGYGLKEIKEYLLTLPTDQPVLVATEGSFGTLPNGLEIYYQNHRYIKINGVGFPSGGISAGMEAALKDGQRVFLVANPHRYNIPPESRSKLIAEYGRPALSGVEGEKLGFYEIF